MKNISPRAFLMSFIIIFLLSYLTTDCQRNIWQGGNGNWNIAGNWSLGTVPGICSDTALITSGNPVITVPTTIGAVEISSGNSLTLNTTLIVCNSWISG